MWMLEAQVHIIAGYKHLGYLRILFDDAQSAETCAEKYISDGIPEDVRIVLRKYKDDYQSISEPYVENIKKLASAVKGTRTYKKYRYAPCHVLELQQLVDGEWMHIGYRERIYLNKMDSRQHRTQIEARYCLPGWRHIIRAWNGEIRDLHNVDV